ncbi:MAG: hypothetical protein NZ951_01890 [Dehalococcoidia bacterium]|nr:hypothetical protein [Dehalococcoidia bacterium]MDW8119581.1 hypothetical protein [Chloroflexota bacterium]
MVIPAPLTLSLLLRARPSDEELWHDLNALVGPMLEARTPRDMERSVEKVLASYPDFAARVAAALEAHFKGKHPSEMQAEILAAVDEGLSAIRQKVQPHLPPPTRRRLEQALESYRTFLQIIVEYFDRVDWTLVNILLESWRSVQKAGIIISVLAFVAHHKEIAPALHMPLRLLAKALDKYMGEIEDRFLAATPTADPAERARSEGALVPLAMVKERFAQTGAFE